MAKPEVSTTHTKKRPEKAFVLFFNKSIKQTVDVNNYILSIFKRSVSLKRSDLVLWEDLEGAGGEEGGRGHRDGEDM